MTVVVIDQPSVPPISLEEMKAHMRVEHDDDDESIQGMIDAVTSYVDGPDGWLNRALVSQTLEKRLDSFAAASIPLPYPPLISIVSIKYDDADGVEQTLSSDVYRPYGVGASGGVELASGQSWPTVRTQTGSVRIRFIAGYGAAAADVPASLRHALKMLVAHFYNNREEVVSSRDGSQLIEMGARTLLKSFRVFD